MAWVVVTGTLLDIIRMMIVLNLLMSNVQFEANSVPTEQLWRFQAMITKVKFKKISKLL